MSNSADCLIYWILAGKHDDDVDDAAAADDDDDADDGGDVDICSYMKPGCDAEIESKLKILLVHHVF